MSNAFDRSINTPIVRVESGYPGTRPGSNLGGYPGTILLPGYPCYIYTNYIIMYMIMLVLKQTNN